MPDSDGSTQVRRCLFCDAPIAQKADETPYRTARRIFCGHNCRAGLAKQRVRDSYGPDTPRLCLSCGLVLVRHPGGEKENRYRRRRFCGSKCRADHQVRHGNPNATIEARLAKKGRTARQHFTERFDRCVDKSAGSDGCWLWIGVRAPNGYGQFWLRDRQIGAHRYALISTGTVVPPGKMVLHSCDNPPCVNPAHLRVGTGKDNAQDRVLRGRQAVGEKTGRAKLNPASVREIRRIYATGARQVDLAQQFGVSQTVISAVVRNETWAHVT